MKIFYHNGDVIDKKTPKLKAIRMESGAILFYLDKQEVRE